MSTRVAVLGATGRMGRTVVRALAERAELRLVGALASSTSRLVGRDAGENAGVAALGVPIQSGRDAVLERADVAIDFSLPVAVGANVAACVEKRCPIVIGTTGLSEEAMNGLRAASSTLPLLYSPNMSIGVNLMFRIAELAAGILGDDYDAEILDIHHRNKIDAPSGTALRLGDAVARARGVDFRTHAVLTRQGAAGPREKGQIGFAVQRGGDNPGEHKLTFAGPGETLAVAHAASDRLCFARGALRAAQWLTTRPPGFYSMTDVFGLWPGPAPLFHHRCQRFSAAWSSGFEIHPTRRRDGARALAPGRIGVDRVGQRP
jgi:4-hydroxy-tetrahydrodipicolinate reductase